MSLYERDYFKLTGDEQAIVDHFDKVRRSKGSYTPFEILKTPKAWYFNKSHFPNHMLDTDELRREDADAKIKNFVALLNSPHTTEREILTYIASNRSYFLIAALQAFYDFGHHGGFLFPEFPLSTTHVVDYLIVGKNSGGYEFIFVELESVNGRITTSDGNPGDAIRKGIKQVEDWDHWLQKHYHSLKSHYDKLRNHGKTLPDEFVEYDKSRIHFIVVAGRRTDYNDVTYRKRRNLLKGSNIRLLHYDNLLDAAIAIVHAKNYCRLMDSDHNPIDFDSPEEMS